MDEESSEKPGFLEDMNPFRRRPEDVIKDVQVGIVKKIGMIILVVFLFILALQVIKISVSSSTGTLFTQYIGTAISTPFKAFFVGWLGKCLLFSGSPVASLGISLFDTGTIDRVNLIFLIMGSRGGPVIVLFIVGLITYIRKRSIRYTLGLGLVEFLITATTVAFMILFSPLILESRFNVAFSRFFEGSASYADFIGEYFEPLGTFIVSIFSSTIAIFVGIGFLLVAIFLFDKFFTLLQFEKQSDSSVDSDLRVDVQALKEHPLRVISKEVVDILKAPLKIGRLFTRKTFSDKMRSTFSRIIKNPLFAFFLGFLITSVTMSTSVSVGVLVPFYAYRVINIRSVIPYVLASNIATFWDTLFVSILTGNIESVEVVTSLVLSAVIFVAVVGIFFKYYLYVIDQISRFILTRPYRLIVLIGLAIVIPGLIVFA